MLRKTLWKTLWKALALTSTALVIAPLVSAPALAAVGAEEAARLKGDLTPLGAERAGNADGTIPAWTGEAPKAPADRQPGSLGPVPFADEKPLFRITAANMDQYAGKLTESTKHLLQTFPDFYLDIYPTHRTATAPQWVYEGTFRNATRARTEKDGLMVADAFHGIPFPIPKRGIELIWNHYLNWKGSTVFSVHIAHLIAANGRRVLAAGADAIYQYPMYDPDADMAAFDGIYWHAKTITTAPARSADESVIIKAPIDYKDRDINSWQYLPGQRRVRKLPSVNYDTPNFYVSGVTQFDEASGFFGKPDQMDFKVVGKRELYIPYNTNKFNLAPPEEGYGPRFPNPELVRWELHRVWEVEATLKPGQRNALPKRRLFFDEDTWSIVMTDEWDAQGRLYRGLALYSFVAYDLPGVIALPFVVHDFQTRAYTVASMVKLYKAVPRKPDTFYNPDALLQDAMR